MCELLIRKSPWEKHDGQKMHLAELQARVVAGIRPLIPDEIRSRQPDMVKLVISSWAEDPNDRQPFSKIVALLQAE